MKKITAVLSLVFFVLVLTVIASSSKFNGRTIFVKKQKCSMCHSISTRGIEAKTKSNKLKGPDLVNLSARYDSAWLAKYLTKKVGKNGKKHKKRFKGSDEELQALVDWLLE